MGNQRKKFYGLNMMGNRISNVVVDEPTIAAHPVPLDYLEESQTYDTAAAEAQNSSPVMPWAQNLKNLSLKPLLDKVLFPVVNPIWTEPIFMNVVLTVIGEYFIQPGVHLLFENSEKTMRLDYTIAPGDRSSGVTAILTITKNDNTFVTFNSTTTSDVNGTVNFTFDFTNIKSMALTKVWQPATTTKQDNYGNNYKPTEFNSNYTSTYDILELLEETNIVAPPMIYKALTDETLYTAGLTSSMAFTDLIGWTTDKRFYLQPGGNVYVALIPAELYDNCKIYAIFPDENVEVPKGVLTPSGSLQAMAVTYFGTVENYVVCTLDFGWFAAQTNVDIQFIANTDNN